MSDIKNDEDLMIVCQQRWLVSFDNLSSLDQRQSDSLCRLSTGGTHSRRKKYSDGDTSLFKAKRPVLTTSINDVITASDALDRTIRFDLPKITERKTEAELKKQFSEARGRILGATARWRFVGTPEFGDDDSQADSSVGRFCAVDHRCGRRLGAATWFNHGTAIE